MVRRFLRKPLRTGIVTLEIVLGTLAMTLALSAYFGSLEFSARLADRFELNSGSKEGTTFLTMPRFAEDDLAAITALAPDAKELAVFGRTTYAEWPYFIVGGETYSVPDLAAVTPNYFGVAELTLVAGSFFTESDRGDNVLVMSEGSARTFFGSNDPVGQTIEVSPSESGQGLAIPYRVVGIFADTDIRRQEVNGASFYSAPGILLPLWSTGIGVYPVQDSLVVRAKAGREVSAREQVLAAARQVYRDNLDTEELAQGKDFFLTEVGQTLAPYGDAVDPVVVLFGVFGVVSLLTSSIGMFSSTLVRVLERTRELGIRRALGASRRRIIRDLVGETAMLSFVSGVLGVLLAFVLIPSIRSSVGDALFAQNSLQWHTGAALISLGINVGLSVLLSFAPAWQATKITPIEAFE